jgi:hypothetical protein
MYRNEMRTLSQQTILIEPILKNNIRPSRNRGKIIARSIAHFGQSQETLLTTSRMEQLFGYSGETSTAAELRSTPISKEEQKRGTTTIINNS